MTGLAEVFLPMVLITAIVFAVFFGGYRFVLWLYDWNERRRWNPGGPYATGKRSAAYRPGGPTADGFGPHRVVPWPPPPIAPCQIITAPTSSWLNAVQAAFEPGMTDYGPGAIIFTDAAGDPLVERLVRSIARRRGIPLPPDFPAGDRERGFLHIEKQIEEQTVQKIFRHAVRTNIPPGFFVSDTDLADAGINAVTYGGRRL